MTNAIQSNPNPCTLHQKQIDELRKMAIFAAEKIVEKATDFDDIHQCTVALENELRRINQLNGMKPEIEFYGIPRDKRHQFEKWLTTQQEAEQ